MLEGKRIAILVEEGFEDSELMEPVRAMRGVRIKFSLNREPAATEKTTNTGMYQ